MPVEGTQDQQDHCQHGDEEYECADQQQIRDPADLTGGNQLDEGAVQLFGIGAHGRVRSSAGGELRTRILLSVLCKQALQLRGADGKTASGQADAGGIVIQKRVVPGKGIEGREHVLDPVFAQPQGDQDVSVPGGGSADGIIAGEIKRAADPRQGGIRCLKGRVEILDLLKPDGSDGDVALLYLQLFFQPWETDLHAVDQSVHLLSDIQLQAEPVQFPLVVRAGREGPLP